MKQVKISTYLAGPINGKTPELLEEAKKWRNHLTVELSKMNIESLNPFDRSGGDNITSEMRETLHTSSDFEIIHQIVGGVIIPPDLDMVVKADFITLYLPKKDGYEICGTYGEATVAKFLKKPVFLISERKLQDIPHWIIGCSTYVFYSFDEYLRYIHMYFGSYNAESY